MVTRAVVIDGSAEHAALRLDADRRLPALGGNERRHAARRIAASRHLAAIGIPDAHEHVGLTRRLERDELIAADALFPVGDGAHRVRLEGKRARPRVEHDKVVAEPVHLAEAYCRGAGHGTLLSRDSRPMGTMKGARWAIFKPGAAGLLAQQEEGKAGCGSKAGPGGKGRRGSDRRPQHAGEHAGDESEQPDDEAKQTEGGSAQA